MRHPCTSLALHRASLLFALASATLAGSAAAQDALYYKFDENGGTTAINYASGSGVAPQEGTLVGGNTPQFGAGRFGPSALQGGTAATATGSTYVDTGWTPNLNGSDFTIAFFMKQRTAPSSTSYFFYSNSGFRMFTGGVANRGLLFRNGTSGTTQDIALTTDVQSLAAAAWVHIALVIDATALTGTWYVDGVAQTPIPLTAGATASGGTRTFRIAGFATYGGLYDVDEFRVSLRAASAAEVLVWSKAPTAADGKYGAGCAGAVLASTGGAPQLGNATYALQVTGANPGAVCALGLGSNRLQLGAIGLPLDLGVLNPALSGCHWESSAELFLTSGANGAGTATFPLPIPNDVGLHGATLFTQALTYFAAIDRSTNGVSLGLAQ